jgi:glycosyltransferase involved in cell wall biosynthesis
MPKEAKDSSVYKKDFTRLNCCVLIPTYNNATKLAAVIESVLAYSDDVIVINDGCTDNTENIIAQFPTIQKVTHPKNEGKGVALRTGFKYAYDKGYRYAITIDSDGQHFAEDLPIFLAELETNKNTLYIGSRNMDQSSVPGNSSFGHKFSNFWFKVETGIDAPDTQSGYRLYPLAPLQNMRFITWRYEFEIEVIVRAAWAGVEIGSVPVKVYYPPKEERISHFRPFKDFTRISILNTVLVTMALLYYIPLRWLKAIKKKSSVKSGLKLS